ncbi:MAG: hypothetical protein JOZ25_10365 [Actinobacteria bacterium]|nr:hypothetical protein [Actinomycetota bacterium]
MQSRDEMDSARANETDAADVLARAKAYPFPRPRSSVVLVGEHVFELVEVEPGELAAGRVRADGELVSLAEVAARAGAPAGDLAAPRRAVLAYGSNASPESLRWKFPDHVSVLPLLRGAAAGVDVVYSAHMSVYGSIPATLQASPATQVEVFVALLTDAQLERMTAWEINAAPERLDGLAVALECAPRPGELTAFVSRHGCLTAEGGEIAVAAVDAESRTYPAMTEPEVLEHARRVSAPDLSLDEFVLEGVRDYARARQYTERLKRSARPFIDPRERPASGEGRTTVRRGGDGKP